MPHGDTSGAFCDPDSLGQKHRDTRQAGPSSPGVGDPREGCGGEQEGSAGWVSLLGGGALVGPWLRLRFPQVHQDQGEAVRVPDGGDLHGLRPARSSELRPGARGQGQPSGREIAKVTLTLTATDLQSPKQPASQSARGRQVDLRWPRGRIGVPTQGSARLAEGPSGAAAARGLQPGCQALLAWVGAQVGGGRHGWQRLHCLSVALPAV